MTSPAPRKPARIIRAMDFTASMLGLIILSPLLLGITIAICLGSRGPVFFRQVRIGQQGKPFRIWKFRTMVPDAEQRGRSITVGEDIRVTPIGRWLRRWKLDELPQLLNVVAGEMALVGPRPEVPGYVDRYSEAQRRVLMLRPGITDLASIRYRNESCLLQQQEDPDRYYTEVIMPDKIRINLEYASIATPVTHIRVILATLGLANPLGNAR